MARLWTCGMEFQSLIASSPDGSGGAIDTVTFRTGLASNKCDSGVGNAATSFTGSSTGISGALGVTYYFRSYLRFTAFPTATTRILGMDFTLGIWGRITSAGRLQLAQVSTQIGSDSAILSLNTWYRVELAYMVASGVGADDYAELRFTSGTGAGTVVATSSTLTIGSSAPSPLVKAGWIDAPGASKIMHVDDCALNDSTGAAQNTWPGEGSVVLLTPTADSAVGTGWTNDAASASNLFNSVDNKPPIGIADTAVGTGLNQIRNASSASASYDATLTTYAAAGMTSSDGVNVMQTFVSVAAPITTGAKTGSFGIASNPVIANLAFAANSGQFWTGVAAGTYPTGWKWERGAMTYAPSVTVGSAPVGRLTITGGTASRIAMCCDIHVYVDYTIGSAPAPESLVFSARRRRLLVTRMASLTRRASELFVPEDWRPRIAPAYLARGHPSRSLA